MTSFAAPLLWIAAMIAQPSSEAGIVFVVEGVGGWDILGPVAQHALPKAGVKHEIVNFIWTHGRGRLFRDLQDIRYLLQKAEVLANRVRRYREEHPDRPVYLIGRSGGAGLVLAAAERLSPESLERIILLSPAVSPAYDLCPALRAARRGIVSFHSTYDRVVLDWGTKEFGTIDRVYGPSAGLRGFVVPNDLMPEEKQLYAQLVQVSWKPAMILEGNLGTHIGSSMPGFITKEVAPLLKSDGEPSLVKQAAYKK